MIEKLQGIEYDTAMQARLTYPWLTSGAAMALKTTAIIAIMKRHSLFFNGGDIEIGKLADLMGCKSGHIPFIFHTAIPKTIPAWAKQRSAWMCGCFRHSMINMKINLRFPFQFIYYTLIVFIFLPIKSIEIIEHYYLLPLIMLTYALLNLIFNWKKRSWYMFIFPVYALFQVLIIVWLGFIKYIKTNYSEKNVGFIEYGFFEKNTQNYKFFFSKRSFNLLAISLVIFLFIFITSDSGRSAIIHFIH